MHWSSFLLFKSILSKLTVNFLFRIDDSYQDGNPVIYKKHQDNPGSSKAKREDVEVYQEQHDSGEPQTSKDNHVVDTTSKFSEKYEFIVE